MPRSRPLLQELKEGDDDKTRRKIVLANYEALRDFYQTATISSSRWHHGLQITTLVGTAATPIILLWQFPDDWHNNLSKIIQALPSAVAGLAAAINASFRYRQEWVQDYVTLSALMNEQQRFMAGVKPDYSGDEEENISEFQKRMSTIVMAEVGSWQTGMLVDVPVQNKSSQTILPGAKLETESAGTPKSKQGEKRDEPAPLPLAPKVDPH